MSTASPFSEEDLNGIRISKVIVDVAANILRDRLLDVIQNKAKAFNKHDPQTYTSLEDYLFKNKNAFKVDEYFYPDQLKVMFPENKPSKTAKEFDLTLCLNLFRRQLYPPYRNTTLTNNADTNRPWSTEPNYSDTSFASHLVRLKLIRDLNYSHIHTSMRCVQKEMERFTKFEKIKYPKGYSLVAKLEYAIYGLCKSAEQRAEYKSRIDACLEEPICDQKSVDRYKSIIENLVAKDQDTNKLFLEQIELLHVKDNKILKLVQENRAIAKNNYEKVKTNQINLFKVLDKLKINCAEIIEKVYDMSGLVKSLDNINRSIQTVNECAGERHSVLISELSDINEKSEERHSELVSKLDDLIIQTKSDALCIKDCDNINIEDFKGYFGEETEFNIKILILDVENTDKFDMDKLIKSVALTNWNIIVDLSTGLSEMSTRICQSFKRNYVRTNINKLNSSISQSDMSCIMRGEWTCYVVCSKERDENTQAPAETIINELGTFIEHFKGYQSTFMCANFYLRQSHTLEYLEFVDELNKAIKRAVYKINKKETLELVYLCFSDLENIEFADDVTKLFAKKIPNTDKKFCLTNSSQFLVAMTPFESEPDEEFKLPGNPSDVEWSRKDDSLYASFIHVYHKTIGKVAFANETQSKAYVETKKFNFIIGNEIDPETIFINDDMTPVKHATYVETSLMKKMFEKIITKSKKRDFYKNNELITKLYHNHYCGGTTIARVLLYKLRTHLPCIRLLYLDQEDKVIEVLSRISLRSDLPLVILIDTDTLYGDCNENIKEAHVEELSRRLLYSRHIILFVQRSFVQSSLPALSKEEIESFESLYTNYLEENKKLKNKKFTFYHDLITIRLLCLKKTNERDEHINKIASRYLSLLSESDKSLLVFIYFYDKFGRGRYFNTDLIAYILDKPMKVIKQLFIEKTNSEEFKIFHLLQFNKTKGGFKMLIMDLSKRIVELIGEQQKRHTLLIFFEAYSKLAKDILEIGDQTTLTAALQTLTSVLIITNKEVKTRKRMHPPRSDDIDDQAICSADAQNESSDDNEEVAPAEDNNSNDEKDDSKFYSNLIYECRKELGIEQTESILKDLFELFERAKSDTAPYLGCVYARYVFHKTDTIDEKKRALDINKRALKFKDKLKNSALKLKADLCCQYGDLVRHYTNTHIHNDETNQKSEFILELANECLYAYTKSIELNESNPLALIGECRIRYIIVQYYNKYVCEEKIELFKQSLRNPDTPSIIRDSSDKIGFNLEKLEDLRLSSLHYYNISELYFDLRIKLLKLYSNVYLSIENIDSLPESVALNLYEVYKYYKPEYKDWSVISERHLKLMILRYEKQIRVGLSSTYPLSNNYRHSILAYIHLALKLTQPSREYNLETAIGLAKEWVRNFKNEPDAYFYLGVLQLVKAMQNNSKENFKTARYNLKSCKDRYDKMKEPSAPKKISHVEFLIGNEKGLRGLLIFDDNADLNRLARFEGDIENDNGKLQISFNDFKVKCLDRNAIDAESKIKGVEMGHAIRCSYHIAIRRVGLLAYKYQRIRN